MKYYRHWCKKCGDFKLHKAIQGDDILCIDCGIIYTDIYLKDIPDDKLKEQRERYIQKRKKEVLSIVGMMSSAYFNYDSLIEGEVNKDDEIIESDAGQEKLEELQKEKEVEQAKYMYKEIKRFEGLGRNDICVCGSGKKYKRCCLSRIEGYKQYQHQISYYKRFWGDV